MEWALRGLAGLAIVKNAAASAYFSSKNEQTLAPISATACSQGLLGAALHSNCGERLKFGGNFQDCGLPWILGQKSRSRQGKSGQM